MKEIHIHLHHHGDPRLESIEKKIDGITATLETIMPTLAEIATEVRDLRAAIDAEQQQITDAFAALDAKVADLTTQIVAGGTDAERQAVADDLTAAIADVKSTIADAAPSVPPAP